MTYFRKIEIDGEELAIRSCPICLKQLNIDHYIKENGKEDFDFFWSNEMLAIPCCLCNDILLDFKEALEKDELLSITKKGDKLKLWFWFERIKNKGYFKFKINSIKQMIAYGIITEKDLIKGEKGIKYPLEPNRIYLSLNL